MSKIWAADTWEVWLPEPRIHMSFLFSKPAGDGITRPLHRLPIEEWLSEYRPGSIPRRDLVKFSMMVIRDRKILLLPGFGNGG